MRIARLVKWSARALASCLFVACASLTATSVSAQTAPQEELKIVYPVDVPSWDPTAVTFPAGQSIYKAVFDSPLFIDGDLKLRPSLIKSWKWADDKNTRLTIQLRDDVTFHDGSKLTTEDFKYSFFDRPRGDKKLAINGFFGSLKDIEIASPTEATMVFSTPTPTAPNYLGFLTSYILPKAYIQRVGEDGFQANPIGAGPYKIVLADPDLPDPDTLAARIRAAHAAGRPVAVHSVTRESLVVLLVALEIAGRLPGDRIEHAALVPQELVASLAGLAVVTQPGFLADRGDLFRRDVPAAEHGDLYRCRSLVAAGIPVALSSDAPYGPVDPWSVLRAASTRHTPDGDPLGPHETLTPRQALDALTAPVPGAPPRALRPGAPADLVLLHVPLADALRAPEAGLVRATVVDGRWVHRRD